MSRRSRSTRTRLPERFSRAFRLVALVLLLVVVRSSVAVALECGTRDADDDAPSVLTRAGHGTAFLATASPAPAPDRETGVCLCACGCAHGQVVTITAEDTYSSPARDVLVTAAASVPLPPSSSPLPRLRPPLA